MVSNYAEYYHEPCQINNSVSLVYLPNAAGI